MKLMLNFTQEKETKGAVRYVEDGEREERAIGTLYLRKDALKAPYPTRLEVTVETGE
jgi:hypothetical protein